MKDCERCKNVEICKLEKPKDKCAFINPLSAYEQIKFELEKELCDANSNFTNGVNAGIEKAIKIIDRFMK